MSETLQAVYQPLLLSTLLLLLALEWLSPWQRRKGQVQRRWFTNIGLYCGSYLVPALVLPAGVLVYHQQLPARGLSAAGLPLWASIVATVLLLDAWRYWEHRLFHRVSLLWNMHLVHHSDTALDITTAQRHHPFEALLALLSLLLFTWLLVPPVEGLLVYSLMAGVISLWGHANIDLPPTLDRALRMLLVTPAVHAIHHSDQVRETDSNYSTAFTLWDRAFGTYTPPRPEHAVRFGLGYFHRERDRGLWPVLLQPLRYHPGMDYPPRTDLARAWRASDIAPLAQWQAALALLLACSLLLSAAFPAAVQSMITTWSSMGEWQYAILVLPLFFYLLLTEYRQELLSTQPRASWAGLVPAAAGAALMLAGDILDINIVRQIALVVFLQALILAIVGPQLYRRYLALWLFPFLMVPYGDLVTPVLRHATLWSVEVFSSLTGHTVEARGFSLTVAGNQYTIVRACAGMNYFTLAVFLAYGLALVLYRRLLPVLAVTAAAGALAILANFARVNTIILLDRYRSTQAGLDEHSPFFWLALLLMFGLMFLLLTRLRPPKFDTPADSSGNTAGPSQPWRPVATTALCLLPLLLYHNPSVRLAQPPAFTPPATLAGYTRVSNPGEWQHRRGGQSIFTTATYRNNSTQMVVMAEFPVQRRYKLDSWRIPPDTTNNWTPERRDYRSSCQNCAPFIHHTWVMDNSDNLYNVYASYLDRGQLTTSPLRLRWQRGMHRIRGGSEQYFAMVAIISDEPIPDPDAVSAILSGLQGSLDRPEQSRDRLLLGANHTSNR